MRILSFINLAGLLAVGVLCAAQWQGNRQLNQEIQRLEALRIDQASKLDERDKTISGQAQDLKLLGERLTELTDELKTAEGELRLERAQSSDRARQIEELKENVSMWADAVAVRDERIESDREQIVEMAARTNDTVAKYNELAERYSENVALLNERTEAYNELVTRYNDLAEASR